jgi:hypothetical protein
MVLEAANQMFSAFPEMTFSACHESWLRLVVLSAEKMFETWAKPFFKGLDLFLT